MKDMTKPVSGAAGIEINDQFRQALNLMENTRKNIFITGKAGTGKSTLLDHFRRITRKRVAVLAPTGVAALNIQGQTIHSFFGFRSDVTMQSVKRHSGPGSELYRAIEAIIIDEISMVRADLLDCVDKFMRLNGRTRMRPFGGVQMIFIGDMYQLPPVVTGKEKEVFVSHFRSQYFFDSKAFENLDMEFVELEKIYRQKDGKFIDILNSIRNRSVSESQLDTINKRVEPFFKANPEDFYIELTTTNKMAAEINEERLAKIKSKPFIFKAKIKGNFDRQHLPTDMDMKVKIGSQIMMVNNDPGRRWVNGSVGKIVGVEKVDKDYVIKAELANGNKVEITPYTWKISRLYYNSQMRCLDSETIGSFTQYPLRLAWAVTIHKSQGKTFERVIIDIGRGTFAHGQLYVALSRCTSLDGLVLRQPIQKKHILMDWRVVKFLTEHQYALSDKKCSLEGKVQIIRKSIAERKRLNIIYLKSNDEKSRRTIQPKRVGKMSYLGKSYIGVEAFCFSRQEDRVFRVDRILEMEEA